MFGDAVQAIHDWAAAPFRQQMSLTQVLLLIGLVIVGVILWQRVIAHIIRAAEEI